MNVILFNMFDLPDYLKICIKQILHTNPDCTIHLITDKNISDNRIKCYNINSFVCADHLFRSFKFYKNNSVKYHFELFTSSAFRFLFIEELSRNLKLKNIFTFDNDVLIYGKFDEFIANIDSCYDTAITQSVLNEYICGFSYFKDYNSLVPIAGDFRMFMCFTEDQLKNDFKSNFTGNFLSEMSLFYYICSQRKINHLVLPSYPDSNIFNKIFDPITYGQALDGRSPHLTQKEDSFIDRNHLLGNSLDKKEIEVFFDRDQKQPYVKNNITSQTYKLFNLHLHSKNLAAFKSYE